MSKMRKSAGAILIVGLLITISVSFVKFTDAHAYALEAVSESGTMSAGIQEESPCRIIVTNRSTGEKKEIQAEDSLLLATNVEEFRWFGDRVLAAISHVNPSLSCLQIYDVNTLELLDERYGLDFQWAKNDYTSLYYIVPTPHFSEEIGPEKVVDYEEQVIYQTDGGESLDSLAISPDGAKLGILSRDEESKYLTVVESEVSEKIMKTEWDGALGELEWKDDHTLRVSSPEKETEVSAEDGSVLSETEFGNTLEEE